MPIYNVAINRAAGKTIPDDKLEKVLADHKTSISWAAAAPNSGTVVCRRHVGTLSLPDTKAMIQHENIVNRQTIISFGNNPNILTEEDVQPFVVLEKEVDSKGKKTIRPSLVVFLNGDFSHYLKQDSIESGEKLCLQKDIIPVVQKAFKIADGDLTKTMDELKDQVWADKFANCMVGPNGSITLLAGTGDVNTFMVTGDTQHANFPNDASPEYWMSNAYGEAPAEGTGDDLADEFGDTPAATPAAQPRVAPIIEDAPAAAPSTKLKPGHGLPGNKPPGSNTSKVAPIIDDGVNASPGSKPVPNKPQGTPDLTDYPLKINIPSGMDKKTRKKFIENRSPGEFVPADWENVNTITVNRSACNDKFLDTYLKQNKLKGLKDIPLSLDSQLRKAPATATAVAAPGPKSTVPKVAPIIDDESTKPVAKPDDHRQPLADPSHKNTDPQHVGGSTHNIAEPIAQWSSRQIEELLAFAVDPAVKTATDMHGKIIATPSGLEREEKKMVPFEKQFGGKLTLAQIAMWPLANFLRYVTHDPNSGGKVAFCLALELLKANKMLDTLTDPHTKAQPAIEEPAKVAAVAGGRSRVAPIIND